MFAGKNGMWDGCVGEGPKSKNTKAGEDPIGRIPDSRSPKKTTITSSLDRRASERSYAGVSRDSYSSGTSLFIFAMRSIVADVR